MVSAMAAMTNPMRARTQRRRCFVSTKLEVVTVLTAVLVLATTPPPDDEVDENGSAQHSENHGDRKFKWYDDGSADNIRQGDHHDADHHDPAQVGSKLLTLVHGNKIGDDSTKTRQYSNDHGEQTGSNGHNGTTTEHHRTIFESHRGRDFVAEAGHRKTVGNKIHDDGCGRDDPQ